MADGISTVFGNGSSLLAGLQEVIAPPLPPLGQALSHNPGTVIAYLCFPVQTAAC